MRLQGGRVRRRRLAESLATAACPEVIGGLAGRPGARSALVVVPEPRGVGVRMRVGVVLAGRMRRDVRVGVVVEASVGRLWGAEAEGVAAGVDLRLPEAQGVQWRGQAVQRQGQGQPDGDRGEIEAGDAALALALEGDRSVLRPLDGGGARLTRV